jgi:heme/copper-type cytochrome/quinol oxidase subunit 1
VERIDRLGLGQRIVLVVGLAVLLQTVGTYIATLGNVTSGWTAYAPLSGQLNLPNLGLRPGLRLLLWIGLTLIWMAASVRLLRGPRPDR